MLLENFDKVIEVFQTLQPKYVCAIQVWGGEGKLLFLFVGASPVSWSGGDYSNFVCRYQNIIKDITKRMGLGMAEFCQRPVVSVADYNLYCHYVAVSAFAQRML